MINELKPNEVFVDIPGYENYYAISNFGRVYSHQRGNRRPRFMSLHTDGSGYPFVRLQVNKSSWQPKVHRLVAEAFVEKVSGKSIVNHIDGDKSNNLYTNLEWVTQSENIIHAFSTGLSSQKGSKNACAKLTEEKVREIREAASNGDVQRRLAEKYMVSPAVICRVVKGRGWTNA